MLMMCLPGMCLGHEVPGPRFRLNTVRNIVYHLLQGVTARIVHIESHTLEAWKDAAEPWLKTGRLHLIV